MKLILLLFLFSCAGDFLKKSPDLDKGKRFYKLRSDQPGIIYHRKCSERGRKRSCVETEFDILREWDFFSPEFILIPYSEVFP